MKNKIKKGIAIFLIGYLIMFGARIAYVFVNPVTIIGGTLQNALNNSSGEKLGKRNYASSNVKVTAAETAKTITVDQKYERVGFVSAKTDDFEKDSAKLKDIIKEEKAVVQFENNTGIKGGRQMELSIGVHPDKFDGFVEKVKVVGKVYDFRVEKVDKTSEYKDLKARLATLEKARDSLEKLKEKGGNVNDLINLETRILEMEEKIQNMGVQLGDYSAENELCTVKMTLRESGVKETNSIGFGTILKNIVEAFAWSLGYYLMFILMLALSGGCAYLLLVVAARARAVYMGLGSTKPDSDNKMES